MTFRGFLYALARFLGDVNAIQKGQVGRRIARRLAGKLTGRLLGRLFGAWLLVALGAGAVGAQQRVDVFDTHGRRTGYVIVDDRSGRVDLYDAQSRRVGYGQVQEGRLELFRPDGTRQGTGSADPKPERK